MQIALLVHRTKRLAFWGGGGWGVGGGGGCGGGVGCV